MPLAENCRNALLLAGLPAWFCQDSLYERISIRIRPDKEPVHLAHDKRFDPDITGLVKTKPDDGWPHQPEPDHGSACHRSRGVLHGSPSLPFI